MKNERANRQYTIPLYETDGMLASFSATVTGIHELTDAVGNTFYGIELDKTAFFPEGGGQPGDTGWLSAADASEDNSEENSKDNSEENLKDNSKENSKGNSKENSKGNSAENLTDTSEKVSNASKVFDTQTDENGRVLHYVKDISSLPTVGGTVTGRLDFDIRLSRMQNHGAEHLICGLIHNRFGYENTGFHMSEEGVVYDVDGPLTDSQIREIEAQANEVIYKNLPITISFPSADEAKCLEYRSKLDTFDDIRLVTIKDTDVCACCAPQLPSTGLIGIVKIIDRMPHRQGMRMTLLAGRDAYNDYVGLHDENAKIMALLSSKRSEAASKMSDFADRFAKLKEENTSLKKELVSYIAENEIARIKSARNPYVNPGEDGNSDENPNAAPNANPGSIHVVFADSIDTTGLRNLVNKCVKECGGIIAGFCANDPDGYNYIIGKSDDLDTDILPELAKKLNTKFCGRGGGNVKMVQGSISASKNQISAFLDSLR